MRYLIGLICVLALGVMPLVGCSDEETIDGTGGTGGEGGEGGEGGTGGNGLCAELRGDWTLSAVSCDGVPEDASGIDYRFADDCTGEMIITESANCEATVQITFLPAAMATTVDLGAVTCGAGCMPGECQETADWGQPYESSISHSGDTWTSTTVVTAQMVSDQVTPCEVGETMVSVLTVK